MSGRWCDLITCNVQLAIAIGEGRYARLSYSRPPPPSDNPNVTVLVGGRFQVDTYNSARLWAPR